MQEAYTLVGEGKLLISRKTHVHFRKLTLVYIESAPMAIPSLDSQAEYLTQEAVAARLGVSVIVLRAS